MNVLVTGGASGLGRAITEKLATDGRHTIFFTWATSGDQAAALTRSRENTREIRCDFRSESDVARLVERIGDLGIQALVNNAMTGMRTAHFHKLPPESFAASFVDGIAPVMRITQAAIRQFRRTQFGKIVTILTTYLTGTPPVGLSQYTAEKAYLLAMAKSWATENAAFNITSNCISPAFMRTSLTAGTDERVLEQLTAAHPLKRLLTCEETADAVVYLLGASQQINGVNLMINAAERML